LGAGAVEDEAFAPRFTGGEGDFLPPAEVLERERFERREIGITPFLVAGGREGEQGHPSLAARCLPLPCSHNDTKARRWSASGEAAFQFPGSNTPRSANDRAASPRRAASSCLCVFV